jgi:endonuclease/exonuclease/phosphatase family metal-dependent hydrolase
VRFLTYNIRHAEGYDGWVSNSRVARIVRSAQPDVVGLNELWHIPRLFEQPRLLAGQIVGCRLLDLPRGIEHRGALLVDMVVNGIELTFGSTHLSLGRAKRAQQIEMLRQELPRDRPLVLAGDFNCLQAELEPLGEFLTMIVDSPPTFPAIRPSKALDHILFSSHWKLNEVLAIRSLASDHLALVADLEL